MEGANKLRFNIEEKNGQERLKLISAMINDFDKKASA
jgi:transcription-repair coupling factor (superfamily II helicase)